MRTALLLPLLLAAACGAAAPAPPPGQPQRIVTLLPSLTQIVSALGIEERLVGVTEHCRTSRNVARVPWQGAAAAEPILRLQPDLVLRQSLRAEGDDLRGVLERAGIRVVAVPSETVEDIRRGILLVGEAAGEAGRARDLLARFDRRLAEESIAARRPRRPRVLFVFGRDAGAAANITAAGPGSFLDELISLAGGANALAGAGRAYAGVDLETVVRAAPEVILDNMPPEGSEGAAEEAWSRVRAMVPGARFHAILDNDLLIPGPALPEAIRRLAAFIHGDA